MKKYISILLTLCIVLGTFSMTAYAEDKKPFEYEDKAIIEAVQGIVKEVDAFSMDELEYYAENSLGITKSICESYMEYKKNDTLGEFVEFGDSDDDLENDSKVEDTENSVIVTIIAKYEKADVKMVATYKDISGQIVPVEVELELENIKGDLSKIEALKNAALNTLMGITVVVIMLAFISFLISLFRFIPKLQDKFSKKKDTDIAKEAVDNVVAQITETEELVDDTELVAVITAAICAATNTSSDGFVVRSIRKRNIR